MKMTLKSAVRRAAFIGAILLAPLLAIGAVPLTTQPMVLPSYIAGDLPSLIAGTNTTATLSVSSGAATDSTNTSVLFGAGYSWAVTNGNAINGFQGGTTLPNSSQIHFFLCSGTSGTGSFADTQTTARCPTGYNTYFRRIFSLRTNSSGALIPGTAIEGQGGAEIFYLATQTTDTGSFATTTPQPISLASQIPGGVRLQPLIRVMQTSTSGTPVIVIGGDETVVSTAGNFSTAPAFDELGNTSQNWSGFVTTGNGTTPQITLAAGNATSITWAITYRGWIDYRRS